MSKYSVLVVEDSEIDQYIVKEMLERYDPELEILQAFDGQEALDILKSLIVQPLIIFLDINMPRMNGHQFLKKYETSEIEKTVVVMLSSSLQESDKKQCFLSAYVKEYIEKPLDINNLGDVFALISKDD